MTSLLDRDQVLEQPMRRPLYFPAGLPGLEGFLGFTLHGVEGLPVHLLQSDDEPAITLPLADAGAVLSSYTVELSEADAAELGLEREDEAQLFVVLTLPRDGSQQTANLMAPIIASARTGRAKQLILDGSGYSLRHPLTWS